MERCEQDELPRGLGAGRRQRQLHCVSIEVREKRDATLIVPGDDGKFTAQQGLLLLE